VHGASIGIGTAVHAAVLAPYQLHSSRLFQGVVVSGSEGWDVLSFPWLRELADHAEPPPTDGSASAAAAPPLQLSASVVEHGDCRGVRGCALARGWDHRTKLGESFPRVDWVAVPEALRARRVNRRRLRRGRRQRGAVSGGVLLASGGRAGGGGGGGHWQWRRRRRRGWDLPAHAVAGAPG
jgi:hypothetical protein